MEINWQKNSKDFAKVAIFAKSGHTERNEKTGAEVINNKSQRLDILSHVQ